MTDRLPRKPTVVFDTTVLCGALLTQSGANFRALSLSGLLYRGIVPVSVVCEFVRKAVVDGLSSQKRRYTLEEVRMFLNGLDSNLLGVEGEAAVRTTYQEIVNLPLTTPIETVIWNALTKFHPEHRALIQTLRSKTLREVPDLKDIHVSLVAIQENADVIVTQNTRDFVWMSQAIRVMRCGEFLSHFGV